MRSNASRKIPLLALGTFAFLVSDSIAKDRSIPTFLLLGQSNMTGADSVSSPEFPGNDESDASVLFWNRSGWQGKTWEDDLLIIWGMVDFKKWLYEVSSHGVEVGLELYQFHNFIFTCDYVRHS